MARYAAETTVTSESSRAEIERTLTRYGASSFMYGWTETGALIAFEHKRRGVRFTVALPSRKDSSIRYTPVQKSERSPAQQEKAYEQAVRQRWRALALVIKAKLEAVDAGIVTFEEEFAMHFVLPSGRTVAQEVLPAIHEAYQTGQVAPNLQIAAPS